MNDRENSGVIRIHDDVYADLMKISEKTRTPMREIASKALRFAFENSRLVETKVYNISFGGYAALNGCGKE